jgi:putative drug exporter of the RND superfamily
MFARVGAFAVRFRWLIIAIWVVVAAVLTLVAPSINDVAVSDQRSFLPSSALSLTAHEVVTKYFPDRVSPSNAVLVIDAGAGSRADEGDAANLVNELTTWLSGPDAPATVDKVLSPVMGDEPTKAGLTSEDKQVALVLVRFNAIGTEPDTIEAFDAIHDRLAEAPDSLQTYMTGDGPILSAYSGASQESEDSTTWITIVLVIVILLLIYRSPVSPLIPLITIALAYLISRGVVALLGAHALTISMYTNVFLIVVLFGAGTDYCLFLISRFREEMTGTDQSGSAAKTTVRAVGETIASSAGTVIVGLAMMTASELGLYNTSGPSLAISVAITLLAGLTFTPALLTVLGHHAFWPRKAQHLKEGGAWHSWAGKVVKRPVLAFVIPVIVLVPLAIYGSGLNSDFDLLGDLSKDNEARKGFDVLATHFGAGEMQPLTVVAMDPAGYDSPEGLQRTEELATTLAGVAHVTKVRSFTSSLDDKSFLDVAGQLTEVAGGVHTGLEQLGRLADVLTGPMPYGAEAREKAKAAEQLQAVAAQLKDVYGYLVQLTAAYPEVLRDPGYQEAVGALAKLSVLAQGVESGSETGGATSGESLRQAVTQLESLAEGLDALQVSFAAKPDAILLPDLYLKSNEGLKALRDAYISADGTAARLQVVLDSGPYSPQSLSTVEVIRQVLSDGGYDGVVEGNSAVLLDLRDASDRDMTRAIIFVLGGIFVVLLLLLRALVAPVYLILTILLSYAATMGVMRLLFVDVMGTVGVTWWVPMFMFVMLVALGMDYNIFLIGRVKEEVVLNGTRAGTRLALARTGGIITSAGIIMAGTFASMLSGSLLGLVQLGFAVAFGVLLDTFVVRTTLVPAITVLLGRWAWWPRKGPRRPTTPAEEEPEPPSA